MSVVNSVVSTSGPPSNGIPSNGIPSNGIPSTGIPSTSISSSLASSAMSVPLLPPDQLASDLLTRSAHIAANEADNLLSAWRRELSGTFSAGAVGAAGGSASLLDYLIQLQVLPTNDRLGLLCECGVRLDEAQLRLADFETVGLRLPNEVFGNCEQLSVVDDELHIRCLPLPDIAFARPLRAAVANHFGRVGGPPTPTASPAASPASEAGVWNSAPGLSQLGSAAGNPTRRPSDSLGAAGAAAPASGHGSSSDTGDPLLGRTLGQYRLLSRLGRGGRGIVYEAEDLLLGRRVAVKVLDPELTGSKAAARRFLLEARVASKLEHPCCLGIHAVGKQDGYVFFSMPLVRGRSAQEAVDAGGPFDPREATRISERAARGLAAAHALGIIHRDVKPGNILLGENGEVRVADFGLAKAADEAIAGLTEPGRWVGTPHYMSPEQCRDGKVDFRSDLYSLGATYFCLLTGKPPFHGQPPSVVVSRHVNDPLPDPRSIHPAVPEPCVWMISKATHKDAAQRYQTAEELAEALATLAELLGRGGKPRASGSPGSSGGMPVMSSPAVSSPMMSSPGMSSPGMSSPGMSSPGMSSPGMSSPASATSGSTPLLIHRPNGNAPSSVDGLGKAPTGAVGLGATMSPAMNSAMNSAIGAAAELGRREPSIGQLVGRCVVKEPLVPDATRRPVFRALHIPQNRPVRLTLLSVQGSEHRQRIARQAQSLLNLQHPNLVSLVDFQLDSAWEHLAHEWIDAASLAETVARRGCVPPRTGLSILAGACRAAGFCHSHGVVHGNIHAGNVLLLADGSVKVADLGAEDFDSPSDSSSPGNVAVLAQQKAFMAPERQRMTSLDHRTDIFSLGAVLYFALVGGPPWPVGSRSPDPRPGSVATDLDAWAANNLPANDPTYLELRSLIVRAMAEDPAYRFQSVSELLEAIRRLRQNWPAIAT